MSHSLRPGNQPASNAPIWTHTKNVQVNHELDAWRKVWDTIHDPTNGFSTQDKLQAVADFTKKRCATIRIGASLGWFKVPESELIKDFA
ncbi:hypothetical protein EDD11_005563, partial [Mortierella claussenii]